MNPTTISNCLSGIEPLNGANFTAWKEQINIVLGVMDLDYALRVKVPPTIPTATSSIEQKADYERWEKSNRMSLMIMKNSISVAIRGAIPESESAKEFLTFVEEQFKGSSKAHASTLILKMLTSKYDGISGVREHIMMMSDMASKLKGMDMEISEGFLVHFIMTSLPAQFGPFKINYNTQKEKWKMSELIAMCVQEEERLKVEKPDVAHLTTTHHKNKRFHKGGKGFRNKEKGVNTNKNKSGSSNVGSANANKAGSSGSNTNAGPKCHFCKTHGHIQKDCAKFREWLEKKGISYNYVMYESFLTDVPSNTWWVDTGSMIHITNSLQGFHLRRTLRKGERTIRNGNGENVQVEAVGTLPLLLESGFTLNLNDVLYVPI